MLLRGGRKLRLDILDDDEFVNASPFFLTGLPEEGPLFSSVGNQLDLLGWSSEVTRYSLDFS